jgi:hypothetical protein
VESEQAERALLADPDFGATAAERKDVLGRLRCLSGIGIALGLIILFWNIWLPIPYGLPPALGVIAPWAAVGLVRWSRGRLVLLPISGDARPQTFGLAVGGLGSSAWAFTNLHLYDWQEALIPGAICGAIFFAVILALDSRVLAAGRALASLALFCLAWAWGDVVMLDRFADQAAPQVYSTVVGDKYISSGRSSAPYLQVAPWGDRVAVEDIRVNRHIYDATPIQSVICIQLHKGALGVRWFDLGDSCPN